MDSTSLLVFADDWGRHASSCQHLVRHLLPAHRVDWINTIGMRRPNFGWETLVRGGGKIGRWWIEGINSFRRQNSTAELRPLVHDPVMWPSLAANWERVLNRRLLIWQLGRWLHHLPTPPVAVTTVPVVADLVGLLPVKRWIYYCVDDFSVWPGLDGATLARMEELLVARVDRLIAVSPVLQAKLAAWGRPAPLLSHGVDLDFWRHAPPAENNPKLKPLRGLARPLFIFWGVVDRRQDLAFLSALSQKIDQGIILLVGPRNDPDPSLFAIPRVVVYPALAMEDLPALAREASVLIMPYVDSPATRAMQPLKLKEYLATGKPTVIRRQPAAMEWEDCMDVADSAEEFAALVWRRLHEGVPARQVIARARLQTESWATKAKIFAEVLLSPDDTNFV